ncbi:hypothetical protein OUZ56_012854 [Daphnia magna]|uniref:Uncharacterized protein n=1 Tax=Daphnia magna TaxID=35525 RepID=A0ABQ9Z486_9CRUS|nr:hypothetical protein OUZ56_012854 [Daphnia magna]
MSGSRVTRVSYKLSELAKSLPEATVVRIRVSCARLLACRVLLNCNKIYTDRKQRQSRVMMTMFLTNGAASHCVAHLFFPPRPIHRRSCPQHTLGFAKVSVMDTVERLLA